MDQQEKKIYIRRQSQPWTQGQIHHENAYKEFIALPKQQREAGNVRISVDHLYGGKFVAFFTETENNDSYATYVDEYNRRVEIMMAIPAYAAYINLIVDYY